MKNKTKKTIVYCKLCKAYRSVKHTSHDPDYMNNRGRAGGKVWSDICADLREIKKGYVK